MNLRFIIIMPQIRKERSQESALFNDEKVGLTIFEGESRLDDDKLRKKNEANPENGKKRILN